MRIKKHGNQLNKVWEKIASNWVTSICLWEKEKEKRKHCCHLEIEYENKLFLEETYWKYGVKNISEITHRFLTDLKHPFHPVIPYTNSQNFILFFLILSSTWKKISVCVIFPNPFSLLPLKQLKIFDSEQWLNVCIEPNPKRDFLWVKDTLINFGVQRPNFLPKHLNSQVQVTKDFLTPKSESTFKVFKLLL